MDKEDGWKLLGNKADLSLRWQQMIGFIQIGVPSKQR
jgi:hypothetical protein